MDTGTGAKVAHNQQQHVRASERFDLEVKVDLESDHNFYTGLTQNISAGGLFIAETVNPHRISSLKTFWVDLTHQHPIFPEVALAISAIAGFESAFVFAPGFDSFEQARFDSPAYAVVATAPRETAHGEATS